MLAYADDAAWLELKATDYGKTRKQPVKAQGVVTVNRADASEAVTIPKGYTFKTLKDINGDELRYVVTDMLNQLHVKDGLGEACSSKCLGEGDSRFEEQIEFLKENGYQGWFVFENYYTKLPLRKEAEDPIDLFKKDIEKLKRELAKD